MIQAIILCGGSGTRLWPLSTKETPKQFTKIFDDMTLLQQTFDRLSYLTQDIKVVASPQFKPIIHNQIPDISVIEEPEPRDTTAAIAISAFLADPDDILLISPADHYIPNKKDFAKTINQGILSAQEGFIVTFGIVPDFPETGYGYIQIGEEISNNNYTVKSFQEKPTQKIAENFISSGDFMWNSGIFMFKASAFLEELKLHAFSIWSAAKNSIQDKKIDSVKFATIPKISIDYALMEKTKKSVLVKSNFFWSDIGSWKSVHQLAPKDNQNNSLGLQDRVLNSENIYIRANKPITVIGLSNIGIIETDNNILILNLEASQKVKEIAK